MAKCLQFGVLGAEYKLEGPMTPSCRRRYGKAVMGQQVPAKIQGGCDPARSHQDWKGRDMSQCLSLGGGIARHLGITSKDDTVPGSTLSFQRKGNNGHDCKSYHVSPDLRQH